MINLKFELRLIAVITAVRKLRGLKQEALATDLGTYKSHVVKIENALVTARIGQLDAMAKVLDTSLIEIIRLAEGIDFSCVENLSANEILKRFLALDGAREIHFTNIELVFIVSTLKRVYPKLLQKRIREKTPLNIPGYREAPSPSQA